MIRGIKLIKSFNFNIIGNVTHKYNLNRSFYCTIVNNLNNNNNNENQNITSTQQTKLSSKERNILNRKLKKEEKKKEAILKNQSDVGINIENLQYPRCKGCGCTLQSSASDSLGYIPKSIVLKNLSKWGNEAISNKNKKQNKDKQDNKVKETKEKENEDENDVDVEKGQEYFEKFHEIKKDMAENETCQRCHNLKNYGRVTPVKIPMSSFREKLSELKQYNCVVVKVIDLMDVRGSFVDGFRDMVGNNPVILVGNKLDLLPDDIHKDRIETWLQKEAKDRGLYVSHVKLLSSVNKDGLKQFIVELEKLRRERDVFIVGCSNVGKSTFVNTLVNEYNNKIEILKENQEKKENENEEEKVYTVLEIKEKEREKEKNKIIAKATTSVFPGTTLNLTSIPLWEGSNLFDTPGIDNPHQIVKLLTMEELKLVIPTKRIKPTVVHMFSNKTLFLGGLIRIDYTGSLSTFTLYTSPHLSIHLANTIKSDSLYNRQVGKLLTPPLLQPPPSSSNPEEEPKLNQENDNEMLLDPRWRQFKLNNIKNFNITPPKVDFKHTYVDLVISGLGWISIKSLSKEIITTKIKVHAPSNIDFSIRDHPLIPMTDTFTTYRHQ